MALLEKQLEVKESNIPGAGKGLFTGKFIPKGTRIVEYKGRIRTWKDVENEDTNFYIFYVNENRIIDASRYKKSPARFINDAKGMQKIKGLNNNAQFVVDGLRVFVEAIKDIPAGSEIFLGYGKEYWQVIRKNQKLDAANK
ncbi:MAG: nuclear protein [Segetibacter sp.]|jgi:SET domain-containing protein|nr:nuclear protein [Segetibacter sp.]